MKITEVWTGTMIALVLLFEMEYIDRWVFFIILFCVTVITVFSYQPGDEGIDVQQK